MKLNIPSAAKKGSLNPTGEHGPDAPVVSDLTLVHKHDHVHTIHDIDHITRASSFGADHRPVTPDLVTLTQGGVSSGDGKPSAAGKAPRPKVA